MNMCIPGKAWWGAVNKGYTWHKQEYKMFIVAFLHKDQLLINIDMKVSFKYQKVGAPYM